MIYTATVLVAVLTVLGQQVMRRAAKWAGVRPAPSQPALNRAEAAVLRVILGDAGPSRVTSAGRCRSIRYGRRAR